MRTRTLAAAGSIAAALVVTAFALPGLRSASPQDDPSRRNPVEHPDITRPPPTEVAEGHKEEGGKERREAWLAKMHRAPEGTDWKQIEADNVRQMIARRRAIALGQRAAPIGEWVERGSDNQSGSMYTVVRSTDGAGLVAGSSFGGIWTGSLDGEGWAPKGDNVYGGAHQLVALPPDAPGGPDVLLTSPSWLNLVYRSDDDGVSWVPAAGIPEDLIGVRRIVADAGGTVWILGASQNASHILRSLDAGASFSEVRTLNGVWGDLWVARDGGLDGRVRGRARRPGAIGQRRRQLDDHPPARDGQHRAARRIGGDLPPDAVRRRERVLRRRGRGPVRDRRRGRLLGRARDHERLLGGADRLHPRR